MNDCRRRFRFLIPVFILAFVGALSAAVYGLWNHVLVDVVAVKAISYWQAVGLLLLARILFGGWPGRGGRCGPPWKERMMAKRWESLDPAQREKMTAMREEMRRRFGDWPHPPWCGGNEPESSGPAKTETPKT